jgi:glycosyltransferase involved in cell wall biosynthesis
MRHIINEMASETITKIRLDLLAFEQSLPDELLPTRGDLVLGLALGYEPQTIAPWVESLNETRRENTEAVLFIDRDATALKRYLTSRSIKTCTFAQHDYPSAYIAMVRFFDFLHFLRKQLMDGNVYDQVLLTDVRDVVFQKQLFSNPCHELEYHFENSEITIGDCAYNSKWISNTFGSEALNELANENISCAGTVCGRARGIFQYLIHMQLTCLALTEDKRTAHGVDQAIHNYLFYKGACRTAKRMTNFDRVATLHYVNGDSLDCDEEGRVVNETGDISEIAHQWDRHQRLRRKIEQVAFQRMTRSATGAMHELNSMKLNLPGASNRLELPLVSVIITNYNYAQFLPDAVASVEAQTYPNIECIIVDDASTDESGAVLEGIARREAAIKVLRHETNGGQTAAFSTGLAASSGEYVVFLDADDVLLSTFVETHIFVHLSVRKPIGFTSSDMLQTTGNRIVRACWSHLSNYAASGLGLRSNIFRRIDRCTADLWPLKSVLLDDIEKRVHLVESGAWGDWVYAPTSGNCFRRDAVELFLGGGNLMNLKFHGDTYLNKGVCLVSGAVLIDIPLTIYRIHGGNGFSNHAELFGVHAADPEKAFRAEYYAWRAVVDRLIDSPDFFVRKMGVYRYTEALVLMQKACVVNPDFPQFESLDFYLENALHSKAETLTKLIGEDKFRFLMDGVKGAGLRRADHKNFAPRPLLRPAAELFLTAGRALHAPFLSQIGSKLWSW